MFKGLIELEPKMLMATTDRTDVYFIETVSLLTYTYSFCFISLHKLQSYSNNTKRKYEKRTIFNATYALLLAAVGGDPANPKETRILKWNDNKICSDYSDIYRDNTVLSLDIIYLEMQYNCTLQKITNKPVQSSR